MTYVVYERYPLKLVDTYERKAMAIAKTNQLALANPGTVYVLAKAEEEIYTVSQLVQKQLSSRD